MERKNTKSFFLALRDIKKEALAILNNNGEVARIIQEHIEEDKVPAQFYTDSVLNSKEFTDFIVTLTRRRLSLVNALFIHIEAVAKAETGKYGEVISAYVDFEYSAKNVIATGQASGTVSVYIKKFSEALYNTVLMEDTSVITLLEDVKYALEYMQTLKAIREYLLTLEAQVKAKNTQEPFLGLDDFYATTKIEELDDITLLDCEDELNFLKGLYAENIQRKLSNLDHGKIAHIIAILKDSKDDITQKALLNYIETEGRSVYLLYSDLELF